MTDKHTGGQPGPVVIMAVTANFYPEDTPRGFVEWTFAAPDTAPFGAGLYELRFLRLLTDEERATQASQYAAIAKATGASQ